MILTLSNAELKKAIGIYLLAMNVKGKVVSIRLRRKTSRTEDVGSVVVTVQPVCPACNGDKKLMKAVTRRVNGRMVPGSRCGRFGVQAVQCTMCKGSGKRKI